LPRFMPSEITISHRLHQRTNRC